MNLINTSFLNIIFFLKIGKIFELKNSKLKLSEKFKRF